MSQTDRRALIAELRRIAYAAGDVIMGFYDGGTAVRAKADASPVTDADEAAERLIVTALGALTPDIPVAAEEMAAAWLELAPEREFDVGAFDACLDSGRMRAEVELQTAQARAVGVRSTPSFLINGRGVIGAQPIDVFRRVIAEIRDGGQDD